jgi:hypothetical protein
VSQWESRASTGISGQVVARRRQGSPTHSRHLVHNFASVCRRCVNSGKFDDSIIFYCSPAALAKSFNSDPTVNGSVVVYAGQRAMELRDTVDGSVGYVCVSAHPELLGVRPGKGQGQGQMTLTYDVPGAISPPASGQVIDLSSLTALAPSIPATS